MRDVVNVLVATSFSMIITFGLHCALDKAISNNSLFQHIVLDSMHHSVLFCRCLLYEWRSQEVCEYISTMTNDESLFICVFAMIVCSSCIPAWFYGIQVINDLRMILFTMWTVDFLARYVNFIKLRFEVDVLTVYLFLWQFIFIVWKWMMHELFSPIVIIEQGSFCVFLAILSFILYDILYRYVPFKINLLWFWFMSISDIFLTLHPNGWLRILFSNYKFLKSKQVNLHNRRGTDDINSNQSDASPYFCNFFIKYIANRSEGNLVPCCYYTKGIAHGGGLLGFGDFIVYNILLLLVLSLFRSSEAKVWIAFGCIVSMIIGQLGTYCLQRLWKVSGMPGLPLPVICFSTYVLFLDVMITSLDECVYL